MLKWVAIVGGVLVLLLMAGLGALPWLLNTAAFQAYVAQAASRALGRPVKVASLTVAPFPLPTVRLGGLEVADDLSFGPGPFLSVDEGRMRIRLRPLLSGRIELADLTLAAPKIDLVQDDRGRWNWASLGVPAPSAGGPTKSVARPGSPAMGAVLLSRISILDGRMQYRKLGVTGSGVQVENINLTLTQTAPGAALELRGDGVLQPGGVKLAIREAVLTPAGARSLGEMPLKATVEVEAPDVGRLGGPVAATPTAAGTMKGRLVLSGTPARIVATGTADLDRLTLSQTRERCEPRQRQLVLSDLRIPLSYAGTRVESTPLEAKVARGTVSLRLAIDFTSAPIATLTDIRVKGAELEPILVSFLCQPYAVTGPLDLAGQASLRVDDPWRTASGSGRVRIGPGRVMGTEVVNLVNQVAGIAGAASAALTPDRRLLASAPLDFDSITATYTITDGVARTNDLLYQSADVRMAAAGTYGLHDGRINMEVTLTQGQNEVKGLVSGTAGAVRVVPTGVRVPDTRGIRKLLDRLFR
jgi:AsmA protein